MNQLNQIQISEGFKRKAIETIFSIILFIIIYLLLVFLALGLTFLCAYLAFLVVSLGLNFITIIIGLGLLSIGVLQLIFLIKFMFKKHVNDLSEYIEITEADEPELFQFIKEIVEEVDTQFPKRIFLSSEVNASVFYDSSFWSMFLPIKKNLLIGIGLVNTINRDELKAILAHEFGHFSQRSMKVGSYVYNVNRVLYNLLYDTEGYNEILGKWSSVHGFMGFFVSIAAEIASIIQKILKWVYDFINVSHNSLSREMEFHADEVAAHIAGYKPLADSLLRMDLANTSYSEVLNFYQNKLTECKTSNNLFPNQFFVMEHLATMHDLPKAHQLPSVSLEHLNLYNKSKLNMFQQWATHPSVQDRVKALEKTGIQKPYHPEIAAASLFSNFKTTSEAITLKIFQKVTYTNPTIPLSESEFEKEYLVEFDKNSLPKIFNNYFSTRLPIVYNNEPKEVQWEQLFTESIIDLAYTQSALESDISQLKALSDTNNSVKTFDYDGSRYAANDAPILLIRLEKELQEIQEKLNVHDQLIATYFYQKASEQNKLETLNSLHQQLARIEQTSEVQWKNYLAFHEAGSFMNETLAYDIIAKRMETFKNEEEKWKTDVNTIYTQEPFCHMLLPEHKEIIENYLQKDRTYFEEPHYNNAALQVLWDTMNLYGSIWLHFKFQGKKQLLQFYAELQ